MNNFYKQNGIALEDYKQNVTGKIKILNDNRYGFIVADEPVDELNHDIFFHFASLADPEIRWEDLSVGQKVTIGMVSISSKGFQAINVEPLTPKSRARSARS